MVHRIRLIQQQRHRQDHDRRDGVLFTTGPDGALWFTEGGNQIGRITTDGVITQYVTPTTASGSGGIIWTSLDGMLLFTNENHSLWRVTLTASDTDSHDFNGDGYSDVLWRDSSGNVAVWEMNGTTVLNPNTAGVGNVATVWTIQDPLGQ